MFSDQPDSCTILNGFKVRLVDKLDLLESQLPGISGLLRKMGSHAFDLVRAL